VEQDHAADEGDRVIEHHIAMDWEEWPEDGVIPPEETWDDLEELPIESEEEKNEDQ
jgi:hypothetical protein